MTLDDACRIGPTVNLHVLHTAHTIRMYLGLDNRQLLENLETSDWTLHLAPFLLPYSSNRKANLLVGMLIVLTGP